MKVKLEHSTAAISDFRSAHGFPASFAHEGRRWVGFCANRAGVTDRCRGGGRVQAGRQPLGRGLIADGGIRGVRGRPYANRVRY
jgi:hypothetical protein